MHTNSTYYSEMLVHTALCTHKEPKRVLLVSDEPASLLGECDKYESLSVTQMDTKSFAQTLHELEAKSIDVLILDDALVLDKALIAHINAALADDALMVCKVADMEDAAKTSPMLTELGSYFKILMPFFKAHGSALLLASKGYHPTADIILQRSDLLEENSYYNADLHVASFAMPNYIKRDYLGAIRN